MGCDNPPTKTRRTESTPDRTHIHPHFLTKVLHKPAALSLGRVGRTKHAPLAGLQRSRPGHLALFLELRVHPRHHPQGRDEAKTREHLGRQAWGSAWTRRARVPRYQQISLRTKETCDIAVSHHIYMAWDHALYTTSEFHRRRSDQIPFRKGGTPAFALVLAWAWTKSMHRVAWTGWVDLGWVG